LTPTKGEGPFSGSRAFEKIMFGVVR
jgi:hypothetical protein